MKMNKYFLSIITGFIALNINSQTSTVVIPNETDSRVITTGVPFLLIASDARAASMGDMGVATLSMFILSLESIKICFF